MELLTILSGISQESHNNFLGFLQEFSRSLLVVSQASFRSLSGLKSLSGVSQMFFSQIKSLSQFFEGNAQALKTESLFSLVLSLLFLRTIVVWVPWLTWKPWIF